MTLLLNRSDLEGLLGPPGCLAALRQGFVAEPVDVPARRVVAAFPGHGARVVVDDLALAVEMGALGNVGLEVKDAAGTLRDVLRGDAPGRVKDDEITVYAPVGMPWQDLAVSWVAYRAALSRGSGVRYDFLGQ